MNKIFNINLGGYPFTIDHDAYEHLSDYLKTIHKHFQNSEGYEEITSDIETRMAEIFHESLDGRSIVTMKDVKDAIAIMGTPEDFGAETVETEEEAPKSSKSKKKYRTGKRLYRNSEDEVIGGVCAGIAAYFGITDPLWIRIAAVALVFIGVGTAIPLYIVLWAILPKAESASDRLHMKGEPVNASNIGKIIEEEMENFSKKMSEFGDELQNEFGSKKKNFATGASEEDSSSESGRRPFRMAGAAASITDTLKKGIHLLGKIIRTIVSAISKIGRPILFIVGVGLIIAFAVGWIASLIGLFYGLPFFSYLLPNSGLATVFGVVNVMVIIGVPLIGMVLTVTRIFFGSHIKPRWRAGLWTFWAVNIISLFFIGMLTVKQFNVGIHTEQGSFNDLPNTDTLHLEFAQNPYKDVWFYIGDELQVMDHQLISNDVEISFSKAPGSDFILSQQHYSRGASEEEAGRLSEAVVYQFEVQGDKLILPKNFSIPEGEKWRNQKVKLTLQVPEGRTIKFDRAFNWHIHVMGLDQNKEHPWVGYYHKYFWTMGSEGMYSSEYVTEHHKEHNYDLKDFSKVHIEGDMQVNIEAGEEFSIALKGGKNSTKNKIEITKIGALLDIAAEAHCNCNDVEIRIIMPSLIELDLENTSDVKIKGFKEQSMSIFNEGRGDIKAYLEVESLTVKQKGRNELDLKGSGNFLKVTTDHHSKLDAERYAVKVAEISGDYNNDTKLAVSDTLRHSFGEHVNFENEGEPVVIPINRNSNNEQ